MLIEFSYLCQKYQFTPKGIIHIGAHDLEEMGQYLSRGVSKIVWVEGNPDLVSRNAYLVDGISQKLFHGLVYSEDGKEVEFNITNNLQSSSILEFWVSYLWQKTITLLHQKIRPGHEGPKDTHLKNFLLC